MGLKFGLWTIRGVHVDAVARRLPVKGMEQYTRLEGEYSRYLEDLCPIRWSRLARFFLQSCLVRWHQN